MNKTEDKAMIRSNAHCHTTWCDGKNTPEEMILSAIEKNFVSLGFSIHSWTPWEPCGVTPEKEQAYRQELLSLREKYRGRIEIIIGVERDSLADRDFSEFDYIIDSTHVLLKDDNPMFIDWDTEKMESSINKFFGGDPYAYCKAFFDHEAEMYAKSDALFAGHIDLVAKFNEGNKYFDETDKRYLNPALEAANCAIERGLPLEINTGAISRGYRTMPYPRPEILKHICQKGGKIIINSDAHSAPALDTAFEPTLELARSCGFKSILRLREKGLEEIGI